MAQKPAQAPGRAPKPAEVVALRETAGLSQTAFGARIGKSLRTVQNIEDGSISMHPTTWSYAQAVCSRAADDWLERTYPGGWDGEKRISWQEQERLLRAYRAGQLSG